MRAIRRKTLRTFLVGIVVGVVLAYAAQQARKSSAPGNGTPSPIPVGVPASPQPSPAEAGPSPTPATEASPALTDSGRVRADGVGAEFTLPAGYRVTELLNAHDASRSGPPQFTITKATQAQEEEYLALIRDLRTRGVATEAPEFAPGQTVRFTLFTGTSDESFAVQLAKEKSAVTNTHGLSGTRYRRVEGLFPYDATYLSLPEGKTVSVVMSYAAAEPAFDEDAYGAVLNTLRSLSP